MQKPSFWRLLGAYSVDSCVTLLVCFICFLKFLDIFNSAFVIFGLAPLFFAINLFYFAVLEGKQGKTLGKKCLRLRTIASEQKNLLSQCFVAYGIDLFVLLFLLAAYYIFYGFLLPMLLLAGKGILSTFFSLFLIPPAIVSLYFVVLEGCFGKTLGKKLMGLQVVQDMPQKQKEESK